MSSLPTHLSSPARQRGATTLLITVLILFLATLLIIAVSRTTVTEQRLSANEMRSRQAFEAAQAGFDHALAALLETGSSSDVSLTPRCLRADGDCSDPVEKPFPEYRFAYCDPNDPGFGECPDQPAALTCNEVPVADLKKPFIVSCGWSDDDLGRRIIRQGFQTVPALGHPSTVPFVAKGTIGVTGSASIWNPYTNLNVWTGGDMSVDSAAGHTYLRDPNLPPLSKDSPPDDPSPSTVCDGIKCYLEVTNNTTTGPDVIANDLTLDTLTAAEMFTLFTGAADVEDYKASVASKIFTNTEAAGPSSPLDGLLGHAVVIEGDFTLPNTQDAIGSRERPVVLIIDGNLTGGGSPEVHGIVYVTGNLDLTGSPNVYGGMIVQGNVEGTGGLNVVYDPFAIENADERVGRSAPTPGDWRDW